MVNLADLPRTSVLHRPRQCNPSEAAEHQPLCSCVLQRQCRSHDGLEGIDFMFSNLEVMPMPVKEYREYMKERKKETKEKAKDGKRK